MEESEHRGRKQKRRGEEKAEIRVEQRRADQSRQKGSECV